VGQPPIEPQKLVLSVDLDEWFHSRRWTEGVQTETVPDMAALFRRLYGSDAPRGDLIPPVRSILALFDRHQIKATFFVLGEVAQWYPDLVREIAGRGHEIACHGLHHVDMTVLGPEVFGDQLDRAVEILTAASGQRPVGYRAPNLVYESWATRILEERGFIYDTTVCASRPIGGKYRNWSEAPDHPYHPGYDDIARPGTARLVELPLPSFPVIRISAGSGILTRVIGFHWTMIALRHHIQNGDTGYYFHPWEAAAVPALAERSWKHAVFYRRTGRWMLDAVDRILTHFQGRVITARAAADRVLRAER
jgi:peptidoglycan/xylan/chitin deacetylase (PgdA/CDA1 family)